jgi:hypothetical protein
MTQAPVSEMEFELRKLMNRSSHLFNTHQYPFEHVRYVELVFSLLSVVTELPQHRVRHAVEVLDNLHLLDIQSLTSSGDAALTLSQRIRQVLTEAGFSPVAAERGETAVRDLARGIQTNYHGKLQRYLREYGQRMVSEIGEHFHFGELKPAQVQRAFTYWLQNVLNMPISLTDESVAKFLAHFGQEPRKLEEIADEMELNLAVVDDLILMDVADREAKAVGA